MAATTDIINALIYTYAPANGDRVRYLYNRESPTWKLLEKKKTPVGGRGQWIVPILKQNAGAFTGITQGGALPSALQPATTEATFSLQEYVGLYDISWKLIQDARKDKFAFEQAIKMLDDGLSRRVMRMLNADIIDNGKGRLGVFSAADDNTTVSLTGLPRCEVGQVVDVMDLSDDDTKLEDSATVTAVNTTTREVTLSAAPASTAAGDYIVIQDTCDDSLNNSLHMHGLLGVVDDADPASVVGDYGGIDRGTAGNEFWESYVSSNSGTNRSFSEDLFLQALDGAREKGGGRTKAILSNLAIGRRYHEILRGESIHSMGSLAALSGGLGRKGDGSKPADDGKSPYNFGGIDWHFDPYFEPNTIVGIDTDHLFVGVGENDTPRPISEIFDNVPFFRQTTSATFEVAWYYQAQLLSDNPAAHWKIEDIAES